MPMYSYQCACGLIFDEFYSMSDDSSKSKCACGRTANKKYTPPALITDTSFFATGGYDKRVCNGRNDKIQGRKDWNERLEKRGLVEIDSGVLDAPVPKPEPFGF